MKQFSILLIILLCGFKQDACTQESSTKLKIALWPLNNLNDPQLIEIRDQVIKPLRNDLERSLFVMRHQSSRPYDVIERERYQKVEERWVQEILLKFPGRTKIKEDYAIAYLQKELPTVDAVFFYEVTEIQSDYLLYVKGLNISKETTTLLATSNVQLKNQDVSNQGKRQNKIKSLAEDLIKQLTESEGCEFGNLLDSSDPVPIFVSGGSHVTINRVPQGLVADFRNDTNGSGVAFKFTLARNVQCCEYLELRGTSTDTFMFLVEYKARKGSELTIVQTSDKQLFPAASQTRTIKISYSGTIDEAVINFFRKGDSSKLIIKSIQLLKRK